MKIFIGGTKTISSLPQSVKNRIDQIAAKGYEIIVGDCCGADAAVQKYCYEIGYDKVVVYVSGKNVRNNIGDWSVKHIYPDKNISGFLFYQQNDIVMAADADYGFMIWDGKSRGTYYNINNMIKQHKSVLVYFAPEDMFYYITNKEELNRLKR